MIISSSGFTVKWNLIIPVISNVFGYKKTFKKHLIFVVVQMYKACEIMRIETYQIDFQNPFV